MYERNVDSGSFSSLASEILGSGRQLRFCAPGSSMLPFIRNGDVLLVEPAHVVKPGDVVLFYAGDKRLVAHRVVRTLDARGKAACLVQGDALLKADGVIFTSNILGRVIAIERHGRQISLDSGIWRWLGLAWLLMSPVSRRLYSLQNKMKQKSFCWLRVCFNSRAKER